MYRHRLPHRAWMFALLLTGPAGAAEFLALAQTCAPCHGVNGVSAGDLMPSIAGLNRHYLETALLEYLGDNRDATLMGRLAKGYSKAQLQALAEFYAAQPWVPALVQADPQQAAKGRLLHEDLCATCHPDGGRGQLKDAPRLAGQWPAFLELYLEDCRAKGAECHPRRMGSRVRGLSDEDLRNLAQFYAGEQ